MKLKPLPSVSSPDKTGCLIQWFYESAVFFLLCGWFASVLGCQRLGPGSVRVGMTAYNMAIIETQNQLSLLNLVRLRYSDTPYVLEVSNVFAAPRFGMSGGASHTFGGVPDVGTTRMGLEYSENPVIVYSPLSGEQFSQRILEPMGLNTLAMLYHAGWNLERVLRLCVQRINNVYNAEAATGPVQLYPPPDYVAFKRIVRTLHELEIKNELEVLVPPNQRGQQEESGLEASHNFEIILSSAAKKQPEVQQLLVDLELDPEAPSYFVTSNRHVMGDRILSIVSRPLIGTMFYLSKGVKVNTQDLANKVVHIPLDDKGQPFDWTLVTGDLFTVEFSDSQPDNAYLAVQYRNTWFYIRDDDVISKDTFNLFQMLAALRAGEIRSPLTPLTLPLR